MLAFNSDYFIIVVKEKKALIPLVRFSKNVYVQTSKAAELESPEPSGTFETITMSNGTKLPENFH